MKPLPLIILALSLLVPALPAQEEPPAQEPAPLAEPDPEQVAMEAFQALMTELGAKPQPTNEEEATAYYAKVHELMLNLSKEHPNTEAGFICLLQCSMLEIQAMEGKTSVGIDRLIDTYKKMSALKPEVTDAWNQLTVGEIGLLVAQVLLGEERYDQAEAWLKDLIKADGPTKTQAEQMLASIADAKKAGEARKQLAVGGKPEFSGADLDGKTITQATYAGKFVLIDFWATWCGPCVKEIPNVVAAYDKYHDKGFEVIGISFDQEDMADEIRSFTAVHKMPWVQIYDGGGWKTALGVKFGIQSIPLMVLLDGEGKVIAEGEDLRGSGAIEAILAKHLDG